MTEGKELGAGVPSSLDIRAILNYLPHRYPMLLVDKVVSLEVGKSITAIKAVTFNEGFFQGHFPSRPIMPGVLIVEALAQAAGILGIETMGLKGSNKLVYFMAIENAKFRQPVEPGCLLRLQAEIILIKGRVCKFTGKAYINDSVKPATEADFTAMVADQPA
jgi:3-hydroxyacyl-[acyl-carrier-protein] dehydratase